MTPIHAVRIFFLLIIATMLIAAPATYAECLNCNFTKTTTDSTYDESYVDEEPKEWSGSLRTKIRRLDDDPVDNLFIPILFGVSLDDLYPNFADPRDGGSRLHEGFDILAPNGTPIISPTTAVVTRVGTGASSGRYVSTANPGGESFIYMHLNEVAVRAGDVLRAGDIIGYVGDTGNAKGGPAHLHLEIRNGRKATDPYPRITKELSLETKFRYLDRIFDDHDTPKSFAEFLVKHFEATFVTARIRGITLPKELEKLVPATASLFAGTQRDLSIGAEGSDVVALQSILIDEGFLDITEPTGRFGLLTQSALKAYQTAHAITPATGYFGPVTRQEMGGVQKKPTSVATAGDGVSIEQFIALLVALDIIPKDMEAKARAAVASAS